METLDLARSLEYGVWGYHICNLGNGKNKNTSKATVNDVRYKVSRIVKLVETVEIKVECHFYFYYALVGLFSANFFC